MSNYSSLLEDTFTHKLWFSKVFVTIKLSKNTDSSLFAESSISSPPMADYL